MADSFKIAFISGKLGDVDGVSLEVDKWITVLNKLGHQVHTIAGKYASPVEGVLPENQYTYEDISFSAECQKKYETNFFPYLNRLKNGVVPQKSREKLIDEMVRKGEESAHHLYDYIQEKSIDLIIAQNTNAMPMTLVGGIAIYKLAVEQRVATIFHHHDFWWERSRFSENYIEGWLNKIMPPNDLGIEHVVISGYAAHILKSIKRVKPYVIHNCEDFDQPIVKDEYNSDFRQELGFKEDDIIIVQPTRIVPRKRIEDSISLVSLFTEKYPELGKRVQFVISLYQGDELDPSYVEKISRLADEKGVSLRLISERVASIRKVDENGKKMYTNRDVLANSDLVTYLPIWEGFGNAFLEAIAANIPVIVTTYLVYKTDIKGAGFQTIEIRDQYNENDELIIEEQVIDQIYNVLTDSTLREQMVNHNFEVAKREFSLDRLEGLLKKVLENYQFEIHASRQRIKKSKYHYFV